MDENQKKFLAHGWRNRRKKEKRKAEPQDQKFLSRKSYIGVLNLTDKKAWSDSWRITFWGSNSIHGYCQLPSLRQA
jgi:hypothetical protein